MESNARYFRRRAAEEYAAAQRAITPAARDRHLDLSRRFLTKLDEDEANEMLFEWGMIKSRKGDRAIKRPDYDLLANN